MIDALGTWFKARFVALDAWVNRVVLRGKDETISSRCGRQIVGGQPCRLCAGLCALIDRLFGGRWKDHCINNIREVE